MAETRHPALPETPGELRCGVCGGEDFLLLPHYRAKFKDGKFGGFEETVPPEPRIIRCADCLAKIEVFDDGTVGRVWARSSR